MVEVHGKELKVKGENRLFLTLGKIP